MLAKRVIPCLDIKNGRTVKGINFEGLRDAGDPVELAERYSNEGADELVFLDITATNEKRKTLVPLVEDIAKHIQIPFTVGGGIGSVDEIEALLHVGADKVSLNSSIVRNPELISQAAERFGTQCIVAAIDAKRHGDSWNVYINAGKKDTGLNVLDWCKEVAERGAGEILLTSMDKDGTKSGFDNELLRLVSESVSLPLVASGGAGTIQHCLDAILDGKADAVLAASIFHFREIEINDLKQAMKEASIPVRL
ncbi:imidazole glycerol phosphate synthase subunit HisF [Balneolaceae bacterium ANBcel3]|nr:imidazole glycerol phosphate synthase subunit HisF [Balneolaceae bacterium ANBcel3]